MDRFNTYIDGLDMDFWYDVCKQNGVLRRYKKGECFVREGESTSLLGFVVTGAFAFVVTGSDGSRHITGMVFKGTPVTDYLNIVMKSGNRTDIVAVAPSEVWVCDGKIVERLFRDIPLLHSTVADNLFRQTYDRFLDLYRKSPKERYMELLSKCPEILQQMSLKDLASYLRITPTYLSRIRKEITFGTLGKR